MFTFWLILFYLFFERCTHGLTTIQLSCQWKWLWFLARSRPHVDTFPFIFLYINFRRHSSSLNNTAAIWHFLLGQTATNILKIVEVKPLYCFSTVETKLCHFITLSFVDLLTFFSNLAVLTNHWSLKFKQTKKWFVNYRFGELRNKISVYKGHKYTHLSCFTAFGTCFTVSIIYSIYRIYFTYYFEIQKWAVITAFGLAGREKS